jgi:soluble lytic murein transglycosylase
VALRRAWADGAAAEGESDSFADRNAATLTAEDHWRRFGRLMWEGQTGAAGRLQARLDPARRGVAEAWLALRAEREAPAAGEIGPLFETARNHRRRDRDSEAAAAWAAAEPLQRDLPPEAARAIWAERQVLARKLLRLGDPAAAYRVAANHGQAEPGEPRQEAEFLAGFIALRRLNDAAGAQRHFARLARAAPPSSPAPAAATGRGWPSRRWPRGGGAGAVRGSGGAAGGALRAARGARARRWAGRAACPHPCRAQRLSRRGGGAPLRVAGAAEGGADAR